MEHVRTEPGAFRAWFRGAELAAVRVQANQASNGYIARGTLRPDRHGLLFATGGAGEASRINGVAPGPPDIVAMRPGTEILSHTRPGQSWAALLLDVDGFAPLLAEGWRRGADSLLLPGRLRAAPDLPRLVAETGEKAATDPGRLEGAAVRGALAEAFSVALGAALGGAREGRARACHRQLRVASSAVEYLEAAPSRSARAP